MFVTKFISNVSNISKYSMLAGVFLVASNFSLAQGNKQGKKPNPIIVNKYHKPSSIAVVVEVLKKNQNKPQGMIDNLKLKPKPKLKPGWPE